MLAFPVVRVAAAFVVYVVCGCFCCSCSFAAAGAGAFRSPTVEKPIFARF